MADMRALGALLSTDTLSTLCARLRQDIARATTWLQRQAAGPIALYQADVNQFTIWLLAGWQAGRCVILPGDATPTTTQHLQARGALLIGTFPGANECCELSTLEPAVLRTVERHEAVVEVYTSGSTGEPLSLAKTLRQLDSEVAVLEQVFGADLSQSLTFCTTVSHQHLYGLLFCILWPLARGQQTLARSITYPEALLAAAEPYLLISSPAFLKRLPSELAWPQPSHCHQIFSSGGPLPAEASALGKRCLGVTATEIYGSSETGGIARRNDPEANWVSQPGVEVKLDAHGQLAVRSPFLPDQNWFVTADRAQLTETGFVLQGRSDRIVKIEEKRISLTALECVLRQHPHISEARIIPLAGLRTQLAAIAVLSDAGRDELKRIGKFALSQSLRSNLARSFERVALPRRWRFIHQLPMNHMGKTTDAALATLFDTAPRLPHIQHQEIQANRLKLQLELAADLACFDGHFPDLPIVPGVAQLDWAMHFATTKLAIPGDFQGMDAIKFQKIMQPGQVIELLLEYMPEKQCVHFRYQSVAGVHASGKIRMGQPHT